MILIKIIATALIVLGVSYILILLSVEEDPPLWFKVSAMVGLFGSLATLVISSIAAIWI
jgi:hypothetical protein